MNYITIDRNIISQGKSFGLLLLNVSPKEKKHTKSFHFGNLSENIVSLKRDRT